jgi:putative transposase
VVTNTPKLKEIIIPKSTFYYKSKMEERDKILKEKIEEVLTEFPSYGHKRIALKLKRNKKSILRVMHKFGIQPYRRKRKSWIRSKIEPESVLVNYLREEKVINKRGQVWVTDFTYISFKGRYIYLATVLDRYTREVVGCSVMSNHKITLVLAAVKLALDKNSAPEILHQDQGSEYTAAEFQNFCLSKNILPSYSDKGSPWQNGHQESFFDKFKIDLGDINRFGTLGEAVHAIYQQIHFYNTKRIHTSLKMTPVEFALKNCGGYTSAI